MMDHEPIGGPPARDNAQKLPMASGFGDGERGEEESGRDILPRVGAGCLMMIGCLIAAVGAGGFLFGGLIQPVAMIFYGALGLGFLGAGFFWRRYVADLERERRTLFEEKSILASAQRHGGSVTPAQIALETPLTATQVERILLRLCREGYARPEIREDGMIVYMFGGLS
jgi:hypothetical protein